MSRRRVIFFIVFLSFAIFLWQLPTLLKAIPSRYVAAYLPQPMQALAAREQLELLPTAVVEVDASSLLQNASPSVGTENPTAEKLESPLARSTATSLPNATQNLAASLTATPSPTETPVPTPSPTPTETPIPIPPSARLTSFTHHFQTWNNCGPATLAMALSHFDLQLTQDQTAAWLKPDPEDRNVSPYEMVNFVNSETRVAALERANGTLDILRLLIAAGFPVIVELGIDPPGEYRWMGWYGHYLLVVAYDNTSRQVWVYDSWFGTSETPGENANREGRQLSYEDLERYWQQFDRNYMVLYEPNRFEEVATIVGRDMDDATMWQRALVTVQAELATKPDDAFLWFNLGTVFNAMGDYEKAAVAFDQARAIGLPWRMLWYQFGPYEAYYRVGRYEDVVLLADATLKDRPYFEESFYYRGLALAALGDEGQARVNLEKAVRFNPNFNPAVIALGQLEP